MIFGALNRRDFNPLKHEFLKPQVKPFEWLQGVLQSAFQPFSLKSRPQCSTEAGSSSRAQDEDPHHTNFNQGVSIVATRLVTPHAKISCRPDTHLCVYSFNMQLIAGLRVENCHGELKRKIKTTFSSSLKISKCSIIDEKNIINVV